MQCWFYISFAFTKFPIRLLSTKYASKLYNLSEILNLVLDFADFGNCIYFIDIMFLQIFSFFRKAKQDAYKAFKMIEGYDEAFERMTRSSRRHIDEGWCSVLV